MPTYEYVCESCGHAFEKFQRITEDPIKVCPECSEKKVRRLIGSGAGLIFKGSGFYETDYRSESYKKSAKAETENTTGKTDTATSKPKADSAGSKNTTPAAT